MFGNAQVEQVLLFDGTPLRTSDQSELQRLIAVHNGQQLPPDYPFVEADEGLLLWCKGLTPRYLNTNGN